MVAAHSMNAYAGRRSCRADIQTVNGCRISLSCRPREKLSQVRHPGPDIATHKSRVAPLDLRRSHDAPGEDAFLEPGRKSLNLPLDMRQHVESGTVRHVTIAPRGVPPLWRP